MQDETPLPSSSNSLRDTAELEAAHVRSGTLELSSFEALVGEEFTIIQTLENLDANRVKARLTEAVAGRHVPVEEGMRQGFRLQFELPAANDFAQSTFLLHHPETEDFWAMLVPVSQSDQAFTMAAFFG